MNEAAERHEHCHSHENKKLITLRCHSGLSGDMFLCALALLQFHTLGLEPASACAQAWFAGFLNRIYPEMGDMVRIIRAEVRAIQGWRLQTALPEAHEHRNLNDIQEIIDSSQMSEEARNMAKNCFALLAAREAEVHGQDVADIHFHEVGALDSILDICGVCELFALLQPAALTCSPLPIADGYIRCAHGVMPAPAPATLKLLDGIPVYGFSGSANAGELVTPTAIALLHALDAKFGKWPGLEIECSRIVYGRKEFINAPNGLIAAMGRPISKH